MAWHHLVENKEVLRQMPRFLEVVDARDHFGNDAWTFQQDGAPSHTSKKTQAWCADNLPRFWTKNMWPPSSPDLNVMDFSIWSILESEACATVHQSVESLKASLSAAWDGMSQETVRAAVDSFPKRLRAVRKAKGGHFE